MLFKGKKEERGRGGKGKKGRGREGINLSHGRLKTLAAVTIGRVWVSSHRVPSPSPRTERYRSLNDICVSCDVKEIQSDVTDHVTDHVTDRLTTG